MTKRYIIFLIYIIIVGFAFSHNLSAQEVSAETEQTASATFEINNVSELYKKSDEIGEDSRALEKKLQSLTNVSEIDKRIRPLRESLNEYKQTFKDCKGAEIQQKKLKNQIGENL